MVQSKITAKYFLLLLLFFSFNRPGVLKDLKTMGSVSLFIFFITLLVLARQVRGHLNPTYLLKVKCLSGSLLQKKKKISERVESLKVLTCRTKTGLEETHFLHISIRTHIQDLKLKSMWGTS